MKTKKIPFLSLGIIVIIFTFIFLGKGVTKASGPTVLQPSDFVYLGAMRVPYSGFGGLQWDGASGGGALTGRVVDGHVHLFMTAHDNRQLGEFLDTESYNSDYSQAPRMQLIANYGSTRERVITYVNPATGTIDGSEYTVPNSPDEQSIYWSDATQMLYVTYTDGYNVTLRPNWDVYALDLNSSNATHTAYGPWRLDTPKGPGAQHGFLFYGQLPDGSTGIGGTLQSGNSGNSWGPELFGGLQLPTRTSPTGSSIIGPNATDTYVSYKYGGLDTTIDGSIIPGHTFQPMRRIPADYNFAPSAYSSNQLNPALNGGAGSWLDVDRTLGGAWINLPDKVGMLFVGYRGTGDFWYGPDRSMPGYDIGNFVDTCAPGNVGPHTTSYEPYWFIYNPTDLNKVKNGQLNSWDPQPAYAFNPKVAIAPFNSACGGGAFNNFRAAYFNPATRKLYVTVSNSDNTAFGIYNNVILVYYIKDANNPNYVPPNNPNPPTLPSAPGPAPAPAPAPLPAPTPSPTPTPTSGTSGRDCGLLSVGQSDTLSFNNGDKRFLCFDSRWYDCGWEGGDSYWETKATNGQVVGSWTCNLSSSLWYKATTLVGDFNHDKVVNSLDWSYMNAHWFTADATADLNHDGIVNSLDFSILNRNWLKTS